MSPSRSPVAGPGAKTIPPCKHSSLFLGTDEENAQLDEMGMKTLTEILRAMHKFVKTF